MSVRACVYACEINEVLQGLVSGGGATGECACVRACMRVISMKCYKDWYQEEELQVSVRACVYACEINEVLQELVL